MPETIKCMLCGASRLRPFVAFNQYLDLPSAYSVVVCDCGFCFMSPRPTQEETVRTHKSKFYSPAEYRGRASKRSQFYERRIRDLQGRLGHGGRMLEFGCAGGHFLAFARQAGWQVVGVEISPDLAQSAREEFGLEVLVEDNLCASELGLSSFDLVYMSHVLEHVRDPVGLLRLVAQVLRPGGLLFLEVPNQICSVRDVLRRLLRTRVPMVAKSLVVPPVDPLHHLFFFTPKSLRAILHKAGFSVVELSTYIPNFYRDIGARPRGGVSFAEFVDRVSSIIERGPVVSVYARSNQPS